MIVSVERKSDTAQAVIGSGGIKSFPTTFMIFFIIFEKILTLGKKGVICLTFPLKLPDS